MYVCASSFFPAKHTPSVQRGMPSSPHFRLNSRDEPARTAGASPVRVKHPNIVLQSKRVLCLVPFGSESTGRTRWEKQKWLSSPERKLGAWSVWRDRQIDAFHCAEYYDILRSKYVISHGVSKQPNSTLLPFPVFTVSFGSKIT